MESEYLLPLDIDVAERSLIYARVTEREMHAQLKLSVREFPLDRLREAPLEDVRALLQDIGGAPAPAYLFHLPFCGSTLLSHFLVESGWCVLRDPAVLAAAFQSTNAGEAEDGSPPALQALVTELLAQCFGTRPKIVRTAGYYPEIMGRIRAQCPTARMLFVYADAEFFLLQVLKDAGRRHDMRLLTGNTGSTLSDADCAIDFWLSSVRQALDMGADVGTVDAARLLSRQPLAFSAVQRWLGGGTNDVERVLAGLSRHAKTGGAYDAAGEQQRLERCRSNELQQVESALRRFHDRGGDALLAALQAQSVVTSS